MDAISLFADAVSPAAGGVRVRQGAIVSVDSVYTITVTIAGSSGSVSNVKYLGSITPVVGRGVWLITDGSDIFALGNIETGWTSYTPALGGTGWALGSNGTASGEYARFGSTVHFYASLTFGSTGQTFGAVSPTVSLPVTAASTDVYTAVSGHMTIGANRYLAVGYLSTTTTFLCHVPGTNGLFTALSSTVPATWAAGSVIRIAGTYEAS